MADDIVIKDKPYELPPAGMAKAVCVDIIDLGNVETNFGVKHKGRIVFELDKKMKDGRPFTISQAFNLLFGERSTLQKFLVEWLGRALTSDDRVLKNLVGRPADMMVTHAPSKDGTKTFANIKACVPATGEPLKPSGKYERRTKKDEVKKSEPKPVDGKIPDFD